MRLIPNAALPVSRWHNGAGRKSDIATGDGWLVGLAWLDADAPFSALQGFDRTITLVEGPGFTLEIAGRAHLVMNAPFVPAAFDGGAATVCRIEGPCRVLNVMTARERFRHSVAVVGPGQLVARGEMSFVVLLRGAATVGGLRLGVLDAVQFEGAVAVDGEDDVLVAVLDAASITT